VAALAQTQAKHQEQAARLTCLVPAACSFIKHFEDRPKSHPVNPDADSAKVQVIPASQPPRSQHASSAQRQHYLASSTHQLRALASCCSRRLPKNGCCLHAGLPIQVGADV
jgi:hypothetical protein